MNDFRRQGYQRDSKLFEILTEWGVLDTEQIQLLLFPSARVAQRRLSILFQRGKIKRSTQTAPYFYYMAEIKEPLQRIGINWARLWLDGKCKSWERTFMDYQTSTYTVTNTVTGAVKEYRITDKLFKLPGDNVILITDENINKVREELRCVK